MTQRTFYWLGGAVVFIATMILMILLVADRTFAADLGGNCCADLEERIAELEATAAKKGNRKMTLTVYGVINKAIMHVSGDGIDDNWLVSENSTVESFVGVRGEAQFSPGWKAGYVLEIGVGGYDDALKNGIGYGPLLGPGDTNARTGRRLKSRTARANGGATICCIAMTGRPSNTPMAGANGIATASALLLNEVG